MKTYRLIILLVFALQLTIHVPAQNERQVQPKPTEQTPADGRPCGHIGNRPLQPHECEELAENWRRSNLERFIPTNFSRGYDERAIKLLDVLEPLIAKLDEFVPENATSTDLNYNPKPRTTYGKDITITLRDEEKSKSISKIWLRLWSYNSLKQAEEGLAENGSMIPLILARGSLTGKAIGELSYHYPAGQGKSAYIIFLRRNVVVSISCSGPFEISKDNKKQPEPSVDDPEVKNNRCDTLAQNIDDLIVNLTNK